ncbi:MAG: glycine--tRNA ligase [Candidatus Thermoplasmatota archaeon]|nr:glycine--tRNA ligase [Candidatus Thermoplasmatota archaeon]
MPLDIHDKIMMMAKRRGFIYPSFEIYGGVAGFYDYGPLGSQLKNNIENIWRKYYLLKDNCIEINTPTVTLFEVLKASGHVDEFTDVTVDCQKCKTSYKVEDIIDKTLSVEQALKEGKVICPSCGNKLSDPHDVNLMFSTSIGVNDGRKAFLRPETAQGIFTNFHLLYRYAREKLPFGVVQIGKGYRNEISPRQSIIRLREFNMAEAEVFFDPNDKKHPNFDSVKNKELYLFDNKKEMKLSLEKAVKNKVINNQALAYYMYVTQDFLLNLGVDPKKFRFRKHVPDELAHYATECWDAEIFSERFGWVECVGIADRSAYDLGAHIESSGTDMYALRKYDESKVVDVKKVVPKMDKLGPLFKDKAGKIKELLEKIDAKDAKKNLSMVLDGKTVEIPSDCYEIKQVKEKRFGEKFVPHVIEPSYGIDRILYFVLEHNYVETKKKDEEYTLLRLNPLVAPIKVGIFPLVGDEKLVKIAKEIDASLRNAGVTTYYDDSGTIGRRYARMDEIGTPFCITVDHDTLNDKAVTIRDRDTTEQERIKINGLVQYFEKKLS